MLGKMRSCATGKHSNMKIHTIELKNTIIQAKLLSPCGSQFTITPDARPDDSAPGDAFELKWEFDEDSQCYYVSFPDDQ